jgi:hypothetical protein
VPSALAAQTILAGGVDRVIFDFDGTLARTNITTLYFHMRRAGFVPRAFYPLWLGLTYAIYGLPFKLLDAIDRLAFQRRFYRWYGRYTVAEMHAEAERFFALEGSDRWIPAPFRFLQCLKASGAAVEIHSSNLRIRGAICASARRGRRGHRREVVKVALPGGHPGAARLQASGTAGDGIGSLRRRGGFEIRSRRASGRRRSDRLRRAASALGSAARAGLLAYAKGRAEAPLTRCPASQ